MKHSIFHITVIGSAGRFERNVIAESSIAASLTALNIMKEPHEQFALICKPHQVQITEGMPPCLNPCAA